MDKLPRIIGPAPSEMTFEALCDKLTIERERVSRGLYAYLNQPAKVKKKKAASPRKPKADMSLFHQAEALGLTLEDIERMAKELKG